MEDLGSQVSNHTITREEMRLVLNELDDEWRMYSELVPPRTMNHKRFRSVLLKCVHEGYADYRASHIYLTKNEYAITPKGDKLLNEGGS